MHCSYAPQVKSRQHLDILNFACRSIRPISIQYAILGLYISTIQRDQLHQSASADQNGSPLSLSLLQQPTLPTISFSKQLILLPRLSAPSFSSLTIPLDSMHPQPSPSSSLTLSLASLPPQPSPSSSPTVSLTSLHPQPSSSLYPTSSPDSLHPSLLPHPAGVKYMEP